MLQNCVVGPMPISRCRLDSSRTKRVAGAMAIQK